MNRDIVRSHNEVMLVIGVAEPENPFSAPEAESQRRHGDYEENVGLALVRPAIRCVESSGVFGLDGLRQRILIYRRYSHIPFWQLYKEAKEDFSVPRDLLAGAPTSLLTTFVERQVSRLWLNDPNRRLARHWVHEIWSYFRVHLELYVALQQLGLTKSLTLLPNPKFFVPFTEESPMPAPPPPDDFSLPSILRWTGSVFVSTTPFIVWVMARRMLRDWKPQIWGQIYTRLPSTALESKKHRLMQSQTLPSPPPPPPPPSSTAPQQMNEPDDGWTVVQDSQREDSPPPDQLPSSHPGPVEAVRRPSVFSSRGDDYGSDEEDNEGVSATLISFDVEATESTDAPPGLWSAELRPSVASDARANASQPVTYLDTMLTRLPAVVGAHMLTEALCRILMVPYEGTALRLVARTWRLRQGLPFNDMYGANMLSGMTWVSAINFFGSELLHFALCGELWAVFTILSQRYHMTEEEWKEDEAKTDDP
ncbi:hypothetical protein JDV02_005095 [Purpureocillium takamizusanense]|nr:uncharacterized protein JDV02_005095 [Purpureocillium takamizusanense]UNI18854.1 hypothetical protein JDV02_005095 [Purpureocillium takamizusanense]